MKLKPRNFGSHGRATALFCWFTLSLGVFVMNSVVVAQKQLTEPEPEFSRCRCHSHVDAADQQSFIT